MIISEGGAVILLSGYSKSGDITSIGRGGSDATVATQNIDTDSCEIILTLKEYIHSQKKYL